MTKSEQQEIKRCPHCGVLAYAFTRPDCYGQEGDKYAVCCTDPFCDAQTAEWKTKEEAIEKWNRRAQPVTESVDALPRREDVAGDGNGGLCGKPEDCQGCGYCLSELVSEELPADPLTPRDVLIEQRLVKLERREEKLRDVIICLHHELKRALEFNQAKFAGVTENVLTTYEASGKGEVVKIEIKNRFSGCS